MIGSVTTTKFVFGGGSSCEGSTFEAWKQGKPFLCFYGFREGITIPNSYIFLCILVWENQGAKLGSSVVLEQQRCFLEELIIAAVGISCTHHLMLVDFLVQAQVHFLQIICTTIDIINKIWSVWGFFRNFWFMCMHF